MSTKLSSHNLHFFLKYPHLSFADDMVPTLQPPAQNSDKSYLFAISGCFLFILIGVFTFFIHKVRGTWNCSLISMKLFLFQTVRFSHCITLSILPKSINCILVTIFSRYISTSVVLLFLNFSYHQNKYLFRHYFYWTECMDVYPINGVQYVTIDYLCRDRCPNISSTNVSKSNITLLRKII